MEKIRRDNTSKLEIIIVGAGLGGLGAAIALLLAGHTVHVLEGASQISEVGAGIQVLPNSSRVLISWGMERMLSTYATRPKQCNMLGWKGNLISSMDFHTYTRECGTPFWDFHRANLHKCLQDRAVELGAIIEVNTKVVDVVVAEDERTADVVLQDGRRKAADLVVGADGIHSKCREILLAREDPPILTGDLAYRLLLKTEEMMRDPELKGFVEDPQVNYWIGPDAHAVNYVLRGGELFNMVLLVPDDMPAGASTLEGNVEEMRALYKDWDPRIPKLLALCESVYKWRLCIRPTLEPSWSHPSGTFTTLGDAVHATLPYLASGAGMSLEDGHVLGLCLARLTSKAPEQKKLALEVYERCRRARTERVVQRGNLQQRLYHLHDGPEQRKRDELLRAFGGVDGREVNFGERGLEYGADPLAWRWGGVGKWLLTYDCEEDVEAHWPKQSGPKYSASEDVVRERANL